MPEEKNIIHDALIDDRPTELTMRDFKHEEIAPAAGPANFKPITEASDIPFYERRDQDGSSTCMNQAYAKLRGIKTKQQAGQYVSLSGGFAYRRRVNQGSEGMHLHDIFQLGAKYGLPFEAIDPSQNMSESEIVNHKEIPYADNVAKIFTDPNERFLYLPNDFDAIASVISQGYPVLLMLFANRDEYGIKPIVKDPNLTPATAPIRHGICGHFAVRYKNEDLIVIDDSWGILNSKASDDLERDLKERGQRILTREFVNTRVYGAGYIRDLAFSWDDSPTPTPQKPVWNFNRDLEWGLKDDADVRALQDVLKYEQLFPVDQESTGNYFGMTMSAVQAFQKKHNIISYGTPDTTGYGRVGPKTRTKLNALYGA